MKEKLVMTKKKHKQVSVYQELEWSRLRGWTRKGVKKFYGTVKLFYVMTVVVIICCISLSKNRNGHTKG